MPPRYKVGDHVILKSETGAISGWVTKVHTQDFDNEGKWCHASEDEPQYEIERDESHKVLDDAATDSLNESGGAGKSP